MKNYRLVASALLVAALTAAEGFETEIGSPLSLNFNRTMDLFQSTICMSNINQQRANNGKPAVQTHSQVEQAAYNHNLHMRNNDCFSHQCPGEASLGDRLSSTGYRWGGVGEIIAKGQQDCPAVVQAWMNSPGHRNIILGDYVHVGCSRLDPGPWWTCVFAKPL